MRSFIRRLIWLAQRRRREAELRAELQFHLDEEAEERQQEGIAQDQARWAAHRELGNVTRVQESVRVVWIWTFWEQLIQDVRYAVRMMFLPTAFLTSKFIQSFLFDMKPNDPLALTLAVAILASAALLAGYFPARKASRIDPMVALRHE